MSASQKGFAQIIATIGLAIVILTIPLAVKVVEQRQELRKQAYEIACDNCSNGNCCGSACGSNETCEGNTRDGCSCTYYPPATQPPQCTITCGSCNAGCGQWGTKECSDGCNAPWTESCYGGDCTECDANLWGDWQWGSCIGDCNGIQLGVRYNDCGKSQHTSRSCGPPCPTATPTTPPGQDECVIPEDCETSTCCNPTCSGLPRQCHCNACPTPTPVPGLCTDDVCLISTPTPTPGTTQNSQECANPGAPPDSTYCESNIFRECLWDSDNQLYHWQEVYCLYGCSPSIGCQDGPTPKPYSTATPSPTPNLSLGDTLPYGVISPTIESTGVYGGVTVPYGYGSQPMGPYEVDQYLNNELENLTYAAGFVGGSAFLSGGVYAALPYLGTAGTAAYVYGQTALATSPAWVSTAMKTAGVGLEAAGILYVLDNCGKDNQSPECQNAIMMGVTGAQMLQQQQAVDTMALQQLTGRTNLAVSEIDDVVRSTELVLTNKKSLMAQDSGYYLREPGCRGGLCGYVSHLSAHSAERLGGSGSVYQVQDLHRIRNIAEAGDVENLAFRHGFSVVDIKSESYLVDLSFGQFVDPVTGHIGGVINNLPGGMFATTNFGVDTGMSLSQSNVAQSLLKKGYVPLTESNLREYLNITSRVPLNSYEKATDLLRSTKPLLEDYSLEEYQRFFRGILYP